MTVDSDVTHALYQGDDATTSFSIPFAFDSDDEVVVTFRDSTGDETVLVLDTDYSITGTSPSASITYPISGDELASDEYLAIDLMKDFVQATTLSNQSGYRMDDIEVALDYLTMLCAILKRDVDRATKTDTTDPDA